MPTHHSPKKDGSAVIKSPNESIIDMHDDEDEQGASGFQDSYTDLDTSNVRLISGQCQLPPNLTGSKWDEEMRELRNRLATTERQLSEANSLLNRRTNQFQFPPRQTESFAEQTAVFSNISTIESVSQSTMPPVPPSFQAAPTPMPSLGLKYPQMTLPLQVNQFTPLPNNYALNAPLLQPTDQHQALRSSSLSSKFVLGQPPVSTKPLPASSTMHPFCHTTGTVNPNIPNTTSNFSTAQNGYAGLLPEQAQTFFSHVTPIAATSASFPYQLQFPVSNPTQIPVNQFQPQPFWNPSIHQQSIPSFRKFPAPKFCSKNVELWFVQMENWFLMHGIWYPNRNAAIQLSGSNHRPLDAGTGA